MLAVCILFSLSIGVFAATVTPTVVPAEIKAGEDVVVTLTLSDDIESVNSIGYNLYYNAELFTYKSKKLTGWAVTEEMTGENGTYRGVTFVDSTGDAPTLEAGKLGTLTFTAKENITAESSANFTLEFISARIYNADGKTTSLAKHEAGSAASVTVKPASTEPEPTEGYTVTPSYTPTTVAVGDEVTVSYTIDKAYNAFDFTITYDAGYLTYVSATPITATVTNANGRVRIVGFGGDTTDPVTVKFKAAAANASGTDVTITSAKVSDSNTALGSAAAEATVTNPTLSIVIGAQVHNVTLPAGNIFSGNATVKHGENYTFTATDTEHYDYKNITAKIGDTDVTVIDNKDGTYTVKNVTGDLAISGTRAAKQYKVTCDGNGVAAWHGADEAKYGEIYQFTLESMDEGYTYTVTVTIGEKAYTPSMTDLGDMYLYEISGDAIVGDIHITVNKTKDTPETTTIKFVGTGSADVAGGTTQTATTGQDFQFTINEEAGYTYTVKAGETTLTKGTDGKYTIPASMITGTDVTVTVTKTANYTVDVVNYLTLDKKEMYLVTATGPAADGEVLAYDGNAMFWSENYNAYAYLVISTNDLETMKTEAAGKISAITGTKQTVAKTFDVNMTTNVDVNDAQLVWNMYNTKYGDFTVCSMEKFLRADVNADKRVNVQDATAIVTEIMK